MALTPWKKLAVEVLHANPYWKYCKALFIGPSGAEHDYYFCETKGAAQVIAVDADGKIVLIKQYRPLFMEESIEFPMGGTGGQDSLEAARREFAEEAKMTAKHFDCVGVFHACNGILTEACTTYVAWDLDEEYADHDVDEEFEYLRVTVDELEAMIVDGRFHDGMCIAGWHQAKPRVLAVIDQQRAER